MTMVAPNKVPAYVKELIAEYLVYDHELGALVWSKAPKSSRYKAGEPIIDCVSISVAGRRIWYHRVVWFCVYGEFPETGITYRNGNRNDRRVENLVLTAADGSALKLQIPAVKLENLRETMRELKAFAAAGVGISDDARKLAWSELHPREPIPDDARLPQGVAKFKLWRLADYA